MKLRKPPWPDSTGTGLYYAIQAGQRKIAIDLVIEALKALPSDSDPLFGELSEAMREWTIEAVIQGAWVREYHKWETDTKSYFELMHVRNNGAHPNWKKMNVSHVEKVKRELALFSAALPTSITVIDATRDRVNGAKHADSDLASKLDFESLALSINQFWQDLALQESFTPPEGSR
jgi:hypothetical protein